MDFAQSYRIGIDWDHNDVSYFRHWGRKLISPWPSNPILDSETCHVPDTNMTLVTDGLGVRLKTPTVVTIPPQNIMMILLEPLFWALYCKNVNGKLFGIIGNRLSGIEQLCLLILHTLYKFNTRYPEQCTAIVVNVGDADIILN